MNVAWSLVLVTAVSATEYNVEPITTTETMAECYFQSTEVNWQSHIHNNQELLCIRIEE